MTCKMIEDKERGGILTVVEIDAFPFRLKRVFWITNILVGGVRGKHAHKVCQQFYVCIKGIIEIFYNDGKESGNIELKKGQTMFVDKLVWTQETFMTGNDMLLVLCSHSYDSDDYIYNIEKLKDYKNEA